MKNKFTLTVVPGDEADEQEFRDFMGSAKSVQGLVVSWKNCLNPLVWG
jgi:hypothetical protein